jgi:hypothetical protein
MRHYKIRPDEDCGCSINWSIQGDQLDPDICADCCYESNILSIRGQDVAEYVRYEGFRPIRDGFRISRIPESIRDEMRIGEMCAQGDTGNCAAHDHNLRDSLIDYLEELISDGYRLMCDPDRGFANEYTSVLIPPDTNPDDIGEDWYGKTPEDWADDYLYCGDPATQPYNSFLLI